MELKEGDVILLENGHTVYAEVPRHFLHSNRRGDFSLAHGCITLGGEFDYLIGEYVVVKTTHDGGGTGHGSNDTYPDGFHVWCMKADDDTLRVDFYQSGCFTALIENIMPIKKAKLTWKVEA